VPAGASTSSTTNAWVPVCRMEDLPKGAFLLSLARSCLAAAAAAGSLARSETPPLPPPGKKNSKKENPTTQAKHTKSKTTNTKGVRKEVSVDNQAILLFWYRGQPYAVEARSPAEGAYSEGFLKAKFTQEYAIECPSTKSQFSLKDGSIVAWYPNNPVLRALTPAALCRPMAVYPVRYGPDAVYVDVEAGSSAPGGGIAARADRGGAGTSAEGNNVFTVQPSVYFEGQDPSLESASVYATAAPGAAKAKLNPATVAVGAAALGIVAVAGTATAIYYESQLALGLFWLVLGGSVGLAGYRYVNPEEAKAK